MNKIILDLTEILNNFHFYQNKKKNNHDKYISYTIISYLIFNKNNLITELNYVNIRKNEILMNKGDIWDCFNYRSYISFTTTTTTIEKITTYQTDTTITVITERKIRSNCFDFINSYNSYSKIKHILPDYDLLQNFDESIKNYLIHKEYWYESNQVMDNNKMQYYNYNEREKYNYAKGYLCNINDDIVSVGQYRKITKRNIKDCIKHGINRTKNRIIHMMPHMAEFIIYEYENDGKLFLKNHYFLTLKKK